MTDDAEPKSEPQHNIRKLRKARTWTQDDLAEKLGVSRGLVAQWESGETKLTEERIYDLAEAFGVVPGAIINPGTPVYRDMFEIIDALKDAPPSVRSEVIGYAKGKTGAS